LERNHAERGLFWVHERGIEGLTANDVIKGSRYVPERGYSVEQARPKSGREKLAYDIVFTRTVSVPIHYRLFFFWILMCKGSKVV
jgi:hypothetical protein